MDFSFHSFAREAQVALPSFGDGEPVAAIEGAMMTS